MRNFHSSKSWTLNHSYENAAYIPDQIYTGNQNSEVAGSLNSAIEETSAERSQRRRSHYIMCVPQLIIGIGLSAVISGIWPYLQALDSSLTKESLGWVVAASPLSQMIASPILGYISNRLGSIRYLAYFTTLMFIVGNLLYGALPSFTDLWEYSALHTMIFSRFLVGIGSAYIALCRTYLAESTTIEERGTAITVVSSTQTIAHILGPVMQAVLSLQIEDDILKYKAIGWISAILGVFNLIILTPWIFKEITMAEIKQLNAKENLKKTGGNSNIFQHNLPVSSTNKIGVSNDLRKLDNFRNNSKKTTKNQIKLPNKDYLPVISLMFAFSACILMFTFRELMMEPLLTDQYEVCHEIAVVFVGISHAVGCVLGIAALLPFLKIQRKFDDRKLLFCAALIPMCISVFLLIPFGPGTLNYCTSDTYLNRTENCFRTNEFSKTFHLNFSNWCNVDKCYGCPVDQTWCIDHNKLSLFQLITSYIICSSFFAITVSIINTIFSKTLPPEHQGFWTGLLISSGSLSRVVGSILLSKLYSRFGTTVAFGSVAGLILITFLELLSIYKRLAPKTIIKTTPNVNDKEQECQNKYTRRMSVGWMGM